MSKDMVTKFIIASSVVVGMGIVIAIVAVKAKKDKKEEAPPPPPKDDSEPPVSKRPMASAYANERTSLDGMNMGFFNPLGYGAIM